MKLASRMEDFKPSPMIAVRLKVTEMKARGRDIVNLGAGEPDFDTPEHIKDAAAEAMRRGETKYTPVEGTRAMKQAIVDKFKRDNGLEFSLDQVMAGSGGKQVIFNAFMATLDVGDEVLLPAPFYMSYPGMIMLAGGVPVTVPSTGEDRVKLLPDDLRKAITPRSRWLVINSPNNPSGATYEPDELRAIGEVLLEHPHVNLMSDDIYEHILFDGRGFATMARVEPRLAGRILTVNGASKAYAMTGWRLGYAGGPADLIRAMAKIQSQVTVNPSSITQAAAVEALNGPQDVVRERTAVFQDRRDKVVAMLNQAAGISCRRPEGAFYVYPDCAGVIGRKTTDGKTIETDMDFVTHLLEAEGVVAMPGTIFGLSPHFRISIAASEAELEEACRGIQRAAAALM